MKEVIYMNDWMISLAITIIMVATLIGVALFILAHLNFLYGEMPPPNSTQEWKEILNHSDCKWYDLGCQKLACVIDCQEINRNAGENICVC